MKQISLFLKRYQSHVILWSVYLCYELFVFNSIAKDVKNIVHQLICVAGNISIFYIHLFVLSKLTLEFTRDYYKILLAGILELVAFIPILTYFNLWQLDEDTVGSSDLNLRFTITLICQSSYFILFSTGFWFAGKYINERRQNRKNLPKLRQNAIYDVECLNLNSLVDKNFHMRSQINTHFMFNTISFVHNKVKKTDEKSAEIILILTRLMRYTVSIDLAQDCTSLKSEIEQVENLIQLFILRHDDQLNIHFDYDEMVRNAEIIPLAILSLVENMLKHGELNNAAHPANLSITCRGENIHVKTKNRINYSSNFTSTNYGLANLEFRLKEYYGGQAMLHFNKVNDYFLTHLTIPFRIAKSSVA